MTLDERITGVRRLGFSPSQAAFLTRVLLHGGYFLRRQHREFLHAVKGARTVELARRLLARHLATQDTLWNRAYVYHVVGTPLYTAIGQPNSRHRKPDEPAGVIQKLMTLDVVIAHPDDEFLATEAERVAFLTEHRGVSLADLPDKLCPAGPRPGAWRTRYLVDRVPIQLSPGSELVTFVYVAGWTPLGVFARFLERYDTVFRRLGRVCLRFCSTSTALSDEARALCVRQSKRPMAAEFPALDPVTRRAALQHFEARRRFEARAFHTFTQLALDDLRDDLRRFSGAWWEARYSRWCADGDAALETDERPAAEEADRPEIDFVEEPMAHDYPLFGGLDVPDE
jgi:hypothetical protein